MTIAEATKNAKEKAALYLAAKREENNLYQEHTKAEAYAKTTTARWLGSGTETSRAERSWQEAQAALSGAILKNEKSLRAGEDATH